MLANVLVPAIMLLAFGVSVFLWVWFTTGKYAKPPGKNPKD
jgi:hypothetical protein